MQDDVMKMQEGFTKNVIRMNQRISHVHSRPTSLEPIITIKTKTYDTIRRYKNGLPYVEQNMSLNKKTLRKAPHFLSMRKNCDKCKALCAQIFKIGFS